MKNRQRRIDPKKQWTRFSIAASLLCLLTCALVLIGWQYRLTPLKAFPGQVTVVAPNTALVFICCCLSVLCLLPERRSRFRNVLGRGLASASLLFSVLTLAEYVVGVDLGIDTLFFRHRLQDWPVPTPVGRFAIQTTISFVCFSAALILLDRKIGRVRVSEPLIGLGILPTIIAILGYLYHARPLYGVMSVATILLFCVTFVSLGLMRPDHGVAGLLLSRNSGGLAARQLIAAATLVLTAAGWIYLRVRGTEAVEREYGLAILITVELIVFVLLILSTAAKLDRFDRDNAAGKAALERTLAEKQASEDRLNEGLQAANAAIWDLNLQTGELYWSRCHYTLLGYAPGQVKPSLDAWQARIHPDDLERVEQLWRDSLEKGIPFTCEYRVVWPDGNIRWIQTTGKLIRNEQGRPLRSIGGFIDITERRLSQQAVMEAEKLAATGRMAATLAHEINNPLAAVTNIVYLLKTPDSLNTEEARRLIQTVDDEIRRVAQLVQKTLSFYRSDARPRKIRLADVVDEVLWLYQKRIVQQQVHLNKDFTFNEEWVCNGGEIRQVFTNLFVNALDAVGEQGRILIRISRTRDWTNGSGPGVRISILDSGPGIPASYRNQLFTPFFSLKGDRGTGLGLWISKGIMEKNGGRIRFRSRTSRPSGSVFSFFIPEASGAPDRLTRSAGNAA